MISDKIEVDPNQQKRPAIRMTYYPSLEGGARNPND